MFYWILNATGNSKLTNWALKKCFVIIIIIITYLFLFKVAVFDVNTSLHSEFETNIIMFIL